MGKATILFCLFFYSSGIYEEDRTKVQFKRGQLKALCIQKMIHCPQKWYTVSKNRYTEINTKNGHQRQHSHHSTVQYLSLSPTADFINIPLLLIYCINEQWIKYED
jgi:hypothetical protein